MTTLVPVPVTGERKADFDHLYTQPDPRTYFRTLAPLDYQIPQLARPIVERVLEATARAGRPPTTLDLCCSYGINAALLRCRLDLDSLASWCADPTRAGLADDVVVKEDETFYADRLRRPDLDVLGLDVSPAAVAYGRRTGLLRDGWVENLEEGEPSESLRRGLPDVRLVVCTGGVGYVGARTFERLCRTVGAPTDLWVVAFVLRIFDYAEVADVLSRYGLVTERLPGITFPQRRFVDPAEQAAAVLDVSARGLDPAHKEAAGWYHAECFLTRPAASATSVSIEQLLGPVPLDQVNGSPSARPGFSGRR